MSVQQRIGGLWPPTMAPKKGGKAKLFRMGMFVGIYFYHHLIGTLILDKKEEYENNSSIWPPWKALQKCLEKNDDQNR